MKQRIITAIILVIVAIPICIFSGTVAFPIAMAFIGVVGVWELLGCMGTRKYNYLSIPLYVMAVVSPFIFRYFANEVKLYSDKLLFILLCFALLRDARSSLEIVVDVRLSLSISVDVRRLR